MCSISQGSPHGPRIISEDSGHAFSDVLDREFRDEVAGATSARGDSQMIYRANVSRNIYRELPRSVPSERKRFIFPADKETIIPSRRNGSGGRWPRLINETLSDG